MKNRLLILLFFFVLSLGPVISADFGKISLDARDTDIRDLLAGLAKSKGINIIMGNSVQGKVSLNLKDVPAIEAIRLIVASNGLAMEQVGDSIVIIGRPEEIRSLVVKDTKVLRLEHASAVNLKQSLETMLTKEVDVQADPRTNSLIVTGTVTAIEKAERLIKTLDIGIPEKAEIVSKLFILKRAKAPDVSKLLSQVLGPSLKIVSDEKSNSILVTSDVKMIDRIDELISQLEEQLPTDQLTDISKRELKTRLFNLNYIDANSVRDIVQNLISPAGKVQVFARQKGDQTPFRIGGTQGMSRDSFGGRGGMASDAGQRQVRTSEQKWADVLLVTETEENLQKVAELISQLDVKVPQVKIEAKMVEVTLSDIDELGINWSAEHKPSGSTIEGNFPIVKNEGLNIRIGTLSTDYFKKINIKIRALEAKGKAKLISNPSVITLDNEPAQMAVADRVPIMNIYETQFTSTTTYDFINAGVQLTVIPQITDDGYIIMEVAPEIASIKEWTPGSNPQPIISSRMAYSRVRVKDGETLVIAGMIKDEQHKISSRIPLLGKIPLIGYLFGLSDSDVNRTELMIFITPTICK